jgi:hypothetical protein
MLYNFKIKIFIWSILTLLITVGYGQPPGDGTPIADTPKDLDLDYVPPTIKCLELFFSSNNHAVINLDCPERTVFNIDILKNRCGCQNFNILIGGIKIKSVWSEELENLSFTKNDLFNWTFLNEETGQSFLTVEIECVNTIFTPGGMGTTTETIRQRISYPIQLIKSGQEYTAEINHSVNQDLGNYCPNEVIDDSSICCNPDLKIEIENATTTITNFTSSQTIGLEFSAESNFEAVTMKFPLSGAYSWTISESSETLKTIKNNITIDGSKKPKGCQQLGVKIKGEIYTYQKFVATCNLPDIPVGDKWAIRVPRAFELIICDVAPDPFSDCPPIKPIVDPRRNFFNRLSCTGSLVLEVENLDDLYISWTNEDGEVMESPDGNLSGVPLGQYTVTISNKCCEVVTKSYYLCESQTESPYTQKFNGDWCRTVTCYGEGCNEEYEECVTPDRIEDIFDQNQKKCIKEYYYNNQLLGTTSVDATFETEWDDFWEECVTTYFCNGSKIYEDEYEPEDSEWIYDDFWEECRLTVNCMGEEFENVQQVEAEIEWEWDDFWEECVSNYITCDGTEVDGEISIDPYDIGDWTYDSQNGCVRFIKCVYGGDEFRQEIDPEFESTGEQGDCDEGWYEFRIICDGEDIDFTCLAYPFSPPITEFRKNILDNKIKITSNTQQLFIKLKNPSKNISVMISDILGRVTQEKAIDYKSDNVNLLIDGVKTGIYIVTIIQDGKLIHSQKVFIQN